MKFKGLFLQPLPDLKGGLVVVEEGQFFPDLRQGPDLGVVADLGLAN